MRDPTMKDLTHHLMDKVAKTVDDTAGLVDTRREACALCVAAMVAVLSRLVDFSGVRTQVDAFAIIDQALEEVGDSFIKVLAKEFEKHGKKS